MPQIATFLKPPRVEPPRPGAREEERPTDDEEPAHGGGGNGAGPTDGGDGGGGDDGTPEDMGTSPGGLPRLPVVGFFRRLAAFLFDLIGLYFLIVHGVLRQFSDSLLPLGDWLDALISLLVLFYFTLGNGPLGKGQTLGKFLTAIRVTNYDGNVPKLWQAFLRTVLLLPTLVTGLAVMAWLDPWSPALWQWIGSTLTWRLMLAALLGAVLTVGFNAFKQGLHDFWARTLVQPSRAEPQTLESLAERLGDHWQRYWRQPQFNGRISVVLILLALTILLPPRTTHPQHVQVRLQILEGLQARLPAAKEVEILVQPAEEPPYDRTTQDAFIEEFKDDNRTTQTMGVLLQVSTNEPWGVSQEELRNIGMQLSRDAHAEIFRHRPEDSPILGINTEFLQGRPLIYRVWFRQRVSFMYLDDQWEEGTRVTARFDPVPLPPGHRLSSAPAGPIPAPAAVPETQESEEP